MPILTPPIFFHKERLQKIFPEELHGKFVGY